MLQPCKIRSCHSLPGILSCSYGLCCKCYSVRPTRQWHSWQSLQLPLAMMSFVCVLFFFSHGNGIIWQSLQSPLALMSSVCVSDLPEPSRLPSVPKCPMNSLKLKGVTPATNQERAPFASMSVHNSIIVLFIPFKSIYAHLKRYFDKLQSSLTGC